MKLDLIKFYFYCSGVFFMKLKMHPTEDNTALGWPQNFKAERKGDKNVRVPFESKWQWLSNLRTNWRQQRPSFSFSIFLVLSSAIYESIAIIFQLHFYGLFCVIKCKTRGNIPKYMLNISRLQMFSHPSRHFNGWVHLFKKRKKSFRLNIDQCCFNIKIYIRIAISRKTKSFELCQVIISYFLVFEKKR